MVNFIVSIKNVQDFKLPLKRAGPFLSRTSADPEGNSTLALYWGRHFWPCVPAFADLRVCAPTRVEGREDHHHQGQEIQPGRGGAVGGRGKAVWAPGPSPSSLCGLRLGLREWRFREPGCTFAFPAPRRCREAWESDKL